jgi:hypothetical protein
VVIGGTTPVSLQMSSAEGGRVWLLRAGVEACYFPLDSRISLLTCVGVELGRIHAQGYDVRGERSANGTWAASSLAAGLRWHVTHDISLRAHDIYLQVTLMV